MPALPQGQFVFHVFISLLILCSSSSIAAPLRPAHSSLYQMVKKRTLEARTKLQANKYPNHQACVAKPSTTPPPEEFGAVVEGTSMPTYANAQFQAPSQSEPLFKVVSIAHHPF